MKRLVAIDYGLKRTGIAVSDPTQCIATALATVDSVELLSYLSEYAAKEPVATFVLGYPRKLDQRPNAITAKVEAFARRLAQTFPHTPIAYEDERFTSKMAQRILIEAGLPKKKRQDKARIDAISAVLILQSYMERTARQPAPCALS